MVRVSVTSGFLCVCVCCEGFCDFPAGFSVLKLFVMGVSVMKVFVVYDYTLMVSMMEICMINWENDKSLVSCTLHSTQRH